MMYSNKLDKYLNDLKLDQIAFEDADFTNISWRNFEGENALHIAVFRDDYDIAKELIEHGIDLEARGDEGHTPLHEAATFGNIAMVKLFVESGSSVFAFTEGSLAYTLAEIRDSKDICDYLSLVMKEVNEQDKAVWAKARINALEYEISQLKQMHDL